MSQVQILELAFRSVKQPIKSQSGIYWNNCLDHLFNTKPSPIYGLINNKYKASKLPQVQGFRLVTPDPSLLRRLGLGTRLTAAIHTDLSVPTAAAPPPSLRLGTRLDSS